MADLEQMERRKGLEFAKDLVIFAENAPDEYAEIGVHKLAQQLHRHYGYTSRLKRKLIIRHLRQHATASRTEIAIALGIPTFQAKKHTGKRFGKIITLVAEMLKDGIIEAIEFAPAGPGQGRRHMRYRLITPPP